MRFYTVLQVLSALLLCGPFVSHSFFFRENPFKSIIRNGSRYSAEEVIDKSPTELLKLRGFRSEVHFARTKDGYYVNVVRIIHPNLDSATPIKRPVVFNHGLLESATIWLINSRNVQPISLNTCSKMPEDTQAYNGTFYLNGPMMLASAGYDVWLMSMRGTDYSLRNDFIRPSQPQFWDYSLDDFALGDVPTVIDYVRTKTRAAKVGYIGHSQATFSVFGLLATRPRYADIIEPVIAVAPVAYFDHITSIARPLFIGAEELTSKHLNAPFPRRARKIRLSEAALCKKRVLPIGKRICELIELLIGGAGERWPRGFFTHLPFYSSLKVLRHFGQLIERRRFERYDYGPLENVRRYGQIRAPSYRIDKIRSQSLCLISTRTDALSVPKDVERFKRELTVPLYRDIFISKDYNHFDLITSEDSRELVFKPILEIFESLELKTGVCAGRERTDEEEFRSEKELSSVPSDASDSSPEFNSTLNSIAPVDEISAIED